MIMSGQHVLTTDAQHGELREPSIKIPQKQMNGELGQSVNQYNVNRGVLNISRCREMDMEGMISFCSFWSTFEQHCNPQW